MARRDDVLQRELRGLEYEFQRDGVVAGGSIIGVDGGRAREELAQGGEFVEDGGVGFAQEERVVQHHVELGCTGRDGGAGFAVGSR